MKTVTVPGTAPQGWLEPPSLEVLKKEKSRQFTAWNFPPWWDSVWMVLEAFSSSNDFLTLSLSPPSTIPKGNPASDVICAGRKAEFL